MEGGEYLSPECLRGLWGRFDEWVREAAAAAGGPVALLRERAPRWRQVGRVCFHLAENRNDQERPFAFLVTYASGFGAGGRLKHLPLRNALQQYAGANNRAALINLLAPVEEAAKACEWVRALADSGDLYRPLAWPPAHAYRFLQSVPELEQSGAVGPGPQLVAQAGAAAGVGHDRHADAGAGGCRRGAGLQGGGRAR